MSGLLVLRPTAMSDAILTASGVAEADAPEYNAATTYALGAIVQHTATHSLYESGAAGNIGNTPGTRPDLWARIRATNRWRCFDRTNTSKTRQATSISYTFTPGASVPMFAALGLEDCSTVRVRLIDPVYGTVYDHTATPAPMPILPDWWEFFFGEWGGGTSTVLLTDLPSFPNAVLQVDLAGPATMAVAQILFGQPRMWGLGIEYGARVGRQIYSRRDINDFGDIALTKRPSAKRANFDLIIPNEEVDAIQDYFDAIDAELCLFVGSELFESTMIFGIFQACDVLISNPSHSTVQIEILGAI